MKTTQSLDFDGDKIFATFNAIIVNAVRVYSYMLYDEGRKATKVANTWDERIKHFIRTSVRDQTGYVTNLATKWTDLKNNWELVGDTQKAEAYDNAIKYLRFLQGWEIDKAKTGIGADGEDGQGFPKALKIKKTPEWFIGMRKLQQRDVNVKDEDIYHSNAPLAKLYEFVARFRSDLKLFKNAENKCYHISKTFTTAELNAMESILPKIREMEKMYTREMANAVSFYNVGVVNKGQFTEMCNQIAEKYNHTLMSMVNDNVSEDVVAYACYYATNDKTNNSSSSTTFPWKCMFDSMIRLLYRNNNRVSLVRLPENKEIDNIKVVNGMLMINGEFYDSVPYPDKEYHIEVIEGKPFMIVPKEVPVETEEEKKERIIDYSSKTYPLQVNGFKYYNMTSEAFINTVANNNNQFDVVADASGNVRIAVGGVVIANLASKEFERELVNKQLVLTTHGPLTYIPKKITSSTAMKNDKEAFSGLINVTAVIKGTTSVVIETVSEEETYAPFYAVDSSDPVDAYEEYMKAFGLSM